MEVQGSIQKGLYWVVNVAEEVGLDGNEGEMSRRCSGNE